MKTRIVMFLVFFLVCFGRPLPTVAEDGFTAREILRSSYLFPHTGNRQGWMVVEVSEKDEYKTLLIGPAGYRRDISPFMHISEVNKNAYALAVTSDGTVYFESRAFTDEGVTTESTLYSLARDSNEAVLIADLSKRGATLFEANVNEKGDILIVEFDESSLNDTINFRSLTGGLSRSYTLSFPNRIQKGAPVIEEYLDNDGRFLIARVQLAQRGRKLVDICFGTIQSENLSCATADQIARIAFRRNGYISVFDGGKLVIESGGRFNLIDTATLEVTKKVRLGFKTFLAYAVGKDLSIVALYLPSLNSLQKSVLKIVHPLLGDRRYTCDFVSKESEYLLPFTQIFNPSSANMHLVVDGDDKNSNGSYKVLYELSLSESTSPESKIVGGCSVKKKR